MNYSNKTIGTEQEFPNYGIIIKDCNWKFKEQFYLTSQTKIIAVIQKDDTPLVNVSADACYAIVSTNTIKCRLELSTIPAAIDSQSEWDERKEAIRLFAECFLPKQVGQQSLIFDETIISFRQNEHFKLVPKQKGVIFYMQCEAASAHSRFYQCNNQVTLGYTLEMLNNAMQINHPKDSCDVRQETLLWFKYYNHEIDNNRFSPIECFAYSFIVSIFEFSVRVHATFDTVEEFSNIYNQGIYASQNHTRNKNKWGVLPRSSIQHIVNDLNSRNPGKGDEILNCVYARSPNYTDFNFGSSHYSKEQMNAIYKKMIEDFQNSYTEIIPFNYYIKAGQLDSKDTIHNKAIHLMEFRNSYEMFEDEAGNLYPKKNFLFYEQENP